jgi:hypothetical protein
MPTIITSEIASFDTIPDRTRSGGGRRSKFAELFEHLNRELGNNRMVPVDISDEPGDTYNERLKNFTSLVRRKGAITVPFTIRRDEASNRAMLYPLNAEEAAKQEASRQKRLATRQRNMVNRNN